MENLERVQARLDRIRAIQPVLTALRTISLASWRMALRMRTSIQPYREHLVRIARHMAIHRPQDVPLRLDPGNSDDTRSSARRLAVLVLGSERGLCGRYNAAAVERAEEHLAQKIPAGVQVELMALGSRIGRILERRDHSLAWAGKLSLTTLPAFRLAVDMTQDWLERYDRGEVDGVDVVYNEYLDMGHYEPRVTRIVPPPSLGHAHCPSEEKEPEPIIETDPASLCQHLVEQLTAARFHEVLIVSAAAEHSTRYQLMDGAAENAKRITDELTLAIQAGRQQAITREMQELAAGAGLIGQRPR